MPAINTPKSHRFPWYVRLFFWNQQRRYGEILEPTRLWGRSPKVFAALALLFGAFDRRRSPLEPALRALTCVRISQINWCAFCVDLNASLVLKRGFERQKLTALADFANSPLFNEREKAVLHFAEAVTYSDRQPTSAQFNALRHHFDDDAIIELTGLIAFQNLSSKFNAALEVEPQGFCQIGSQRERSEAVASTKATSNPVNGYAPAVRHAERGNVTSTRNGLL